MKKIAEDRCSLGIEFGSTRIKATLINEEFEIVANGIFDWENKYENGIFTYSVNDIVTGLQRCYKDLKQNVYKDYGVTLKKLKSIGISAMMHGYMPFDKEGNLLVPFRTWRNMTTEEAQKILTEKFNFNIPQRWSVAHLYQAILNKEEHVKDIYRINTLAGFVHNLLTGEFVLGIGDASGMFPIDSKTRKYNAEMVKSFDELLSSAGCNLKTEDILPEVSVTGDIAGKLTKEGAKLLDIDGDLSEGIPFCPPEGDAGTGMVATNSVKVRTGNISAGTSIFSMVVLEKELQKVYPFIDIVTTPSGDSVAMVHCNNCTTELNAWIKIFKEYNELFGINIDTNTMYSKLFLNSLKGDSDAGQVVSINYHSGEQIAGTDEGMPLLIRKADSKFNLSNLFKAQIYSCFSTLKVGMNILKDENVAVDRMLGHGGIFKTRGVAQNFLSAALDIPISVTESAAEGGSFGMALLAGYLSYKNDYPKLEDFLDEEVFKGAEVTTVKPDADDVAGYDKYFDWFVKCLDVERTCIKKFD